MTHPVPIDSSISVDDDVWWLMAPRGIAVAHLSLLEGILRIQGQVEFEDVDARLSEEAELSSGGVRRHDAADLALGDAAFAGYARHLEFRGGWRDMRIEPGR